MHFCDRTASYLVEPGREALFVFQVGQRTLDADEYVNDQAFEHWLRTEQTTTGFRWVFSRAPGLEQKLLRLMQAEHACCRFFVFELLSTERELIWVTRGTEASQSVVEEFARLPARLQEHGTSESGIGAVKRHAESAGLTFAADAAASKSRMLGPVGGAR